MHSSRAESAVNYRVKNWIMLVNYFLSGDIEIQNNFLFGQGRLQWRFQKNWKFHIKIPLTWPLV